MNGISLSFIFHLYFSIFFTFYFSTYRTYHSDFEWRTKEWTEDLEFTFILYTYSSHSKLICCFHFLQIKLDHQLLFSNFTPIPTLMRDVRSVINVEWEVNGRVRDERRKLTTRLTSRPAPSLPSLTFPTVESSTKGSNGYYLLVSLLSISLSLLWFNYRLLNEVNSIFNLFYYLHLTFLTAFSRGY
jgi:hypothetical protein